MRLVAHGVAVGLVVLLFALLLWSLVSNEGDALAAGSEAPDFTLERLDEEGELTLSSLRGQAVVLNFWASWCIPCREEAPILERLWQENRSRGLVVVGLDAKDFRRDALDFVERFELTFPIVFDGPGDTVSPYGVTGFPETFVIDREGKIVDVLVGAINAEEEQVRLRRAVEKALEP
ncbi:MAG TPA: TlpA disulfide reductase family protein [Gaiellaceae bacterium]|nr:TlpA disulfide reductase family protein [Gaiellaceae bacterium]